MSQPTLTTPTSSKNLLTVSGFSPSARSVVAGGAPSRSKGQDSSDSPKATGKGHNVGAIGNASGNSQESLDDGGKGKGRGQNAGSDTVLETSAMDEDEADEAVDHLSSLPSSLLQLQSKLSVQSTQPDGQGSIDTLEMLRNTHMVSNMVSKAQGRMPEQRHPGGGDSDLGGAGGQAQNSSEDFDDLLPGVRAVDSHSSLAVLRKNHAVAALKAKWSANE